MSLELGCYVPDCLVLCSVERSSRQFDLISTALSRYMNGFAIDAIFHQRDVPYASLTYTTYIHILYTATSPFQSTSPLLTPNPYSPLTLKPLTLPTEPLTPNPQTPNSKPTIQSNPPNLQQHNPPLRHTLFLALNSQKHISYIKMMIADAVTVFVKAISAKIKEERRMYGRSMLWFDAGMEVGDWVLVWVWGV